MNNRVLCLIAGLTLTALSAANPIRYVPGDYATIQSAIDNSVDGDTIVIAEGTYFENIEIRIKNLVIGSRFILTGDTSYISKTIINGNQKSSVIYVISGAQTKTCITGLTLTNGSGKIHFYVENGIVYDTVYYGGGICISGICSPRIENLRIVGNRSQYGGGIYIQDGSPVIRNVQIIHNVATENGGGLYCESLDGSIDILSSVISHNTAVRGGGINIMGKTIRLIHTEISDNTATYSGADGSRSGGAIFGGSVATTFENVTLVNNKGLNDLCLMNFTMEMHNSIIYKTRIYLYDKDYFGVEHAKIDYSDIENGKDNFVLNNALLAWGLGNITDDPQFVNESNGNYQLEPTSPCIDRGNPDTAYFDENGTRNDMGAYESGIINDVQQINRSFAIEIYPNPGSGIVHIVSGYYTVKSVAVYDMWGKLVFMKTTGDCSEMDLSPLEPEAYILQINTDHGMQYRKVVKM